MNRKDKICRVIKDMDIKELEVYQRKPNTFVKLAIDYKDTIFNVFGFAKVTFPDEWDADYGVELATLKAIHQLARDIIKETERRGLDV